MIRWNFISHHDPFFAVFTENSLLFAQLIARTAKDIDVLVESLPNDESGVDLQLESLRVLESNNQESADMLRDAVEKGEQVLNEVRCRGGNR